MATPKRPDGSVDKVFNRVLVGSLLLHIAMFFLVMTVEPPPPPSQEEYASWLKKVTPPKVVEEVPPPPVEEKVPEKMEEAPPEEVVKEKAPTPAAPTKRPRPTAGKPGEAARRAEVRQQLSGAGLLASIGAASEEGTLANVFESEAVVGKDLASALSERGGVRVSGGTRIGKKGALGAGTGADIGEVDAGAGAAVGSVGGRASAEPKGFVKSSEAMVKKGEMDAGKIQLALKRRERGIQLCFERSLKNNPQLKGRVGLSWEINDQGRGTKFVVIEDKLPDRQVIDCIIDIIQRIRFPNADAGTTVTVAKTFVFESGAAK